MTQQEAIQKLMRHVQGRGGNLAEYSFSVEVKMWVREFAGQIEMTKETWFFVFHSGKIVAHGTSWASVQEKLDAHFGIQPEPITAEVGD